MNEYLVNIKETVPPIFHSNIDTSTQASNLEVPNKKNSGKHHKLNEDMILIINYRKKIKYLKWKFLITLLIGLLIISNYYLQNGTHKYEIGALLILYIIQIDIQH